MKINILGRSINVKLSADGKYLVDMPGQLWFIACELFRPYYSDDDDGWVYMRLGPVTISSWYNEDQERA